MNKKQQELLEKQQEVAEAEIQTASKQVKFFVVDFTIEHLAHKVAQKEYYVPDYQRRFTWDSKRKTRFLESVMMGLPIPFVFFWQDHEGKFEIVDGSQRLRTLEEFVGNRFRLGKDLSVLPSLKGMIFGDLSDSRQRKFKSQSIRGILLENDTSPETRTEMFDRINTGGSKANDAEIRRGSLPGMVTELIGELSTSEQFVRMTPITDKLLNEREREELVVRFLAYTYKYDWDAKDISFIGYKDRPSEFIYKFVKDANKEAEKNEELISQFRDSFFNMLNFVERVFTTGFQKKIGVRQIPRARYEAIAIGSAIALKIKPEIMSEDFNTDDWITSKSFIEATTSDGANTKKKLQDRIKYVRDKLLGIETNG